MNATSKFLSVAGVDGSEHSLAALRWAVDEARLRRGKVRAITAWHYPPVSSTVEDSGSNDSFQVAERVQAEALKAVAAEGVDIEEYSFGIPPPPRYWMPRKTRTSSLWDPGVAEVSPGCGSDQSPARSCTMPPAPFWLSGPRAVTDSWRHCDSTPEF